MKYLSKLTPLMAVVTIALTACGSSHASPVPTSAPVTTALTTTAVTAATAPATSVPPVSTASTAPAKVQPITTTTPISLDGLGPIHVGMTLDEVYKATGQLIVEDAPGLAPLEACSTGSIKGLPDVSFTMHERRIAVMEVSSATHPTPSGLRVGDSMSKVRKTLSPLRERSDGLSFASTSGDGRQLIFTVDFASSDTSKVGNIYSGKSDNDYFVGCD